MEAHAYNYLAIIYFQNSLLTQSETFYQKAIAFFREESYPNDFCMANIGLANIAMFQNDFKQAEERALKNLAISRRLGIRLEERKAYLLLWELSVARHDFEGRKRYKALADSMQNIVVNETMLRAVEELQAKYETEKKELKITALEKEKQLYVWRGIGGIATLTLFLAFFIVRHQLAVSKRKLAEQQVKQLEQEKQLVAAQAVLDGETSERTRLAGDLHDGLGGMLSVVKLNLYDIQKGMTLEREKVVRFDQTMGMLEESISELRRVAHNMMPESLSRSRLSESLTDFCREIPNVDFHYYGSGERLDRKLETMLYRTVIELINNALKHANAENIIVQIVQEPDRLALTVQDDGCGFDTTTPFTGAGLTNIHNRITIYNGRIDIWSQPGEGTDITVELNL